MHAKKTYFIKVQLPVHASKLCNWFNDFKLALKWLHENLPRPHK